MVAVRVTTIGGLLGGNMNTNQLTHERLKDALEDIVIEAVSKHRDQPLQSEEVDIFFAVRGVHDSMHCACLVEVFSAQGVRSSIEDEIRHELAQRPLFYAGTSICVRLILSSESKLAYATD